MSSKEDKEIEKLLVQLGLALVNAQALEYSLVSLFAATALRDHGPSTIPQLRQMMDTRYTQTLGRLLTDSAKILNLDSKLEGKLREALKQRNWLIHHFYREYAPSATNPELRKRATKRVKEIWQNLEEMRERIHAEVVSRTLSAGISQEELDAGIKRATEEYIAEKLAE
jgi:hypothetical protein